jgi:hypothetical protein
MAAMDDLDRAVLCSLRADISAEDRKQAFQYTQVWIGFLLQPLLLLLLSSVFVCGAFRRILFPHSSLCCSLARPLGLSPVGLLIDWPLFLVLTSACVDMAIARHQHGRWLEAVRAKADGESESAGGALLFHCLSAAGAASVHVAECR